MTEIVFTIIIEPDEDSGYVARCLELKGIYGQGETENEALNDAQIALDLALETYQQLKSVIPYRKVVQVKKNLPTAPVTS